MGFTKLDSGIIDSSIWDENSNVLKVFIAFWSKSDPDGIVEATYNAMYRAANLCDKDKNPLPVEDFDSALQVLLDKDPSSRSKENDGRRIIRLEESKWLITTYKKHREQFHYSKNPEAIRKREYRDKVNGTIGDMSQTCPGHYASASASSSERIKEIKNIVELLNSVCKTQFKPTSKNTIRHIKARMNEGFTLNDFRYVICYKNDEWSKDPHMMQYLRPDTLFGTKFESYLNAAKKAVEDHKNKKGKNTRPEVVL